MTLSALALAVVIAVGSHAAIPAVNSAPAPVVSSTTDERHGSNPEYQLAFLAPQIAGVGRSVAPRVNDALRTAIRDERRRFVSSLPETNDPGCIPHEESPDGCRSEAHATYAVTQLTREVLSVQFTFASYIAGGAHGGSYLRALTFDLATGRQLTLGDLFTPRADAVAAIGKRTLALLRKQHVDLLDPSLAAGRMPRGWPFTKELGADWNVTPDGLLVGFDTGTISYENGGAYRPSVVIPWHALRTFRRPHSAAHATSGLLTPTRHVRDHGPAPEYRVDLTVANPAGMSDTARARIRATLSQAADDEVRAFTTALDELEQPPPGPPTSSELTATPLVTALTDRALSIRNDFVSFSAGAAHPNTYSQSLTFDLSTGETIDLVALLDRDARATVAKLVRATLHDKFRTAPLDDQEPTGWPFDATTDAALNFDTTGLIVTFDQCVAEACAAGLVTVPVPWLRLGQEATVGFLLYAAIPY